eukprot:scaffold57209_cov52-Attheya_sp.AAC.3
MRTSLQVVSALLLAVGVVSAATPGLPIIGEVAPGFTLAESRILNTERDIPADSKLGNSILSQARRLDEDELDYTFVSGYSIKFQGCHHISQWNEYAENEDDVRIHTKRLVRFRLCPSSSCLSQKAAGCTTKYGDYVVDMNAFVAAFLEADAETKEYRCEYYNGVCENKCADANDDDGCMASCYDLYSLSYCLEDDAAQDEFAAIDYAACAQFDFGNNNNRDLRRRLDGDVYYYIGPYCAEQGGEIHLGLFTDDSCTTFSYCGDSCFYDAVGFELPYSASSLISSDCLPCAEPNEGGNYEDEADADDVREVCEEIYEVSGKCETKMNVDYPNESACTYIQGISIIRADGVIRTSSVKKSKAAAVTIGLFSTSAVLLGAYVYYLKTKLGRARINLSSNGHILT